MSDRSSPAALRWRCRRGMRELDVLLSRWLQERHAEASPELQQAFVDLLDCEDDQLWDWLLGRSRPQPQFQSVVDAIQNLGGPGSLGSG